MKVTAIYSSPRKNGNSSAMVDTFISNLSNCNAEKFYLSDLNIAPCKSCYGCRNNESKTCVVKDDMESISKAIDSSDIVVMGSPLYWWSISAQLKTVVDRLYQYIGTGRLDNKTLVLLVAGFSDVPNEGYDFIDNMFKEICSYVNMKYIRYFVSADDERKFIENQKEVNVVINLSKDIAL